MKSFERRKKILEILNQYNEIKVKEISDILGVKENNIRRDIRILKNMKLLNKTYGGIKKLSEYSLIEKFFYNELDNNLEKELIAQKAIEYIEKNETIFLGSGTTIFKLAKVLNQYDYPLNIITISLPAATLLAKKSNINLVFIGGTLTRENFSFEDSQIEQVLKYYNVDKAFIGVRGFSYNHGFTIPTIEQAVMLKTVAKSSEEIIILTDSTKFLKSNMIILSTFEDALVKNKIKKVITNKDVSIKNIERLRKENIEVILV